MSKQQKSKVQELKTQIIKDLPNFPEDVVEQFLLPFAEKLGWPPGGCQNDPSNRWKYLLLSNDLDYWRQLKWNKKTLKLTPHKLLPTDIKIVVDLMRLMFWGKRLSLVKCQIPKNGLSVFARI